MTNSDRLPTAYTPAAALFERATSYDRNWETVSFRHAVYLDQLMTDAKRRQEGSEKTSSKVRRRQQQSGCNL